MSECASRLRVWTFLALVVFVIGHFITLSLRGTSAFTQYVRAAEIGTHAFALPAILRAKQVRLSFASEIVVTTAVSILYHTIRNYTNMDYTPYQRLDHGLSTGLICVVFLKYIISLHHALGLVLALTATASSLDTGNILASGATAAVLTAVIAIPFADKAAQSLLRGVVSVLTLGATPPRANDLSYTASQRGRLFCAFLFQIASVFAYFQGGDDDDGTGNEEFWHSLWHACGFTSLFLLTDVIAEKRSKRDRERVNPPRKHRRYYTLAQSASHGGFRFT